DLAKDFRTDFLFNTLFEDFKNDQTILMYISHIAAIFRNRFVYTNQEQDLDEYNRLVKDIINVMSGGDGGKKWESETLEEKMLDFKKKFYARTKSEMGRTFSKKPEIKENTVDGWAPLYEGEKNPEHAILPFSGIANEFSKILDE